MKKTPRSSRLLYVVFSLLGFSFFSFCGDGSEFVSLSTERTVLITAYSFIPEEVTAAPGDAVFFVNRDVDPHRILSQSDNDIFDDTGIFDSAPIAPDATGFISIPDNALPGDVFSFYDGLFVDAMITPNGKITVE